MSARTHFVYRAIDADGVSLYVGCTANPTARYRQHMSGNGDARGWFNPFVQRWHVSGPYTHEVALQIEAERIDHFQPVFNGMSRRNREQPGKRLGVHDYLRRHSVKFVEDQLNPNRALLVSVHGRGGRRLRRVA